MSGGWDEDRDGAARAARLAAYRAQGVEGGRGGSRVSVMLYAPER